LYDISEVYTPLKLLKDGQTARATTNLQIELHSALQSADLVSSTLHRPDMLTNSMVLRAKAMDQ